MKHILAATIFAASAIAAQSQIISREQFAGSVVLLRDQSPSTILINGTVHEEWYRDPQGRFHPKMVPHSGTGFVVAYSNDAYLVTAAHVASRITRSGELLMASDSMRTIALPFADLAGTNAIPGWTHHQTADVAAIKIPASSTLASNLIARALPSSLLVGSRTIPDRDTEITTFGFPLGLGALGQFSPVTKRSHTASGALILPRFDNKQPQPFFLLEDASIGGFSGGPVVDQSIYRSGHMASTGGGTKIFGVVHGTISDETGGKLAAISPAHFVVELLSQLTRDNQHANARIGSP